MATSPGPRWQRLDHDERRGQILACARRLFSDESRVILAVSALLLTAFVSGCGGGGRSTNQSPPVVSPAIAYQMDVGHSGSSTFGTEQVIAAGASAGSVATIPKAISNPQVGYLWVKRMRSGRRREGKPAGASCDAKSSVLRAAANRFTPDKTD